MNRVAIIVLNWNGIDDTLICLDSLLKQSYSDFKIIVVDNGSRDNSVEQLKKYQSLHADKVEIIYNHTNKGFAGGVNTGIEYAIDNDFDLVALFNNDAIADKEWLHNLRLGFDKDKSIGVVTGLLLHADGKTIDSSGDWYSKWGLPFPRNRGESSDKAPGDDFVFGASGGATLYRVEVFKEVGLFDEDFFAYYEDADISFRTQLAGWKVYYTSSAVAYHKQGATSNKIPGFAIEQTFKNLPWLFIKNTPKALLVHIGLRFSLAYCLMFGNAIKNGVGVYATRGLYKSILKLPRKMLERREIQSSKKASTDYIKSILWNDLPPDQTGIRKFRSIFKRR